MHHKLRANLVLVSGRELEALHLNKTSISIAPDENLEPTASIKNFGNLAQTIKIGHCQTSLG